MSATKTFYQAIRQFHTKVGVFVAVHFIILSLSGVLLLFKAEVQGTNTHPQTGQDLQAFTKQYEKAQQFLLEHYPNDKPLDMYPDENNSHIIQARLGLGGSTKIQGARIVNIDQRTGQEVPALALPHTRLYERLLSLHYQLFMGPNGQIYIGIVGIAFVLMNLTGILMLLKKRSRKSSKQSRLEIVLNIHQQLGVICLTWGLLVGITGTLLAFNPIFTKNFQKNTLQLLAKKYHQTMQDPKKLPDIALKQVLQTAFTAKPNHRIDYIVFPGMERGIQNHFLVLMHGNGMLSQFKSEYLIINAKSAELKESVPLPLLMQLVVIATPIHTANVGSILIKIIWCVFALTTLIFVFLGITIFYLKNSNNTRRYAYEPEIRSDC